MGRNPSATLPDLRRSGRDLGLPDLRIHKIVRHFVGSMRALNFFSLSGLVIVGWTFAASQTQRFTSDSQARRLYWILLRSQPQDEILRRVERAAELQLTLHESRYRAAVQSVWPDSASYEPALEQWVQAQREVRAAAFAEIERALAPQQEAIRLRIESLGGRVLRRYLSISLLLAELPPAAAEELARDERVADVSPDPGPIPFAQVLPEQPDPKPAAHRAASAERLQTAQADSPALAIAAGPLWSQGINGRGQWLAYIGSGVNVNHPVFRGVRFEGDSFLKAGQNEPGFSDDASFTVDRTGTGTAAATLLVAQGMPGGWEQYRGIAHGAAGLLVLKAAYRGYSVATSTYVETTKFSDVLDAWEWLVRYRPEVKIVFSLLTQYSEYFAATYGLFVPIRSGLVPETEHNKPDRQYEIPELPSDNREGGIPSLLTVATLDYRGTARTDDDLVSPFSARGPTPNNRRKPDVAAPPTNFWAASRDDDRMVELRGTTAGSAVLLAGAAALLRQGGVDDPLKLKALLINTASRTQWDKAWGWGTVNLQRAYEQRQRVISGEIAPNSSAFYRWTPQGSTSATLVWARRVDRGVVGDYWSSGCQANLDLRLYNETTGTSLGASASTNDSVERVIVNASAPVLAKISYTGTPCRQTERFALAVSDATPLRATGPALSVGCVEPPQLVTNRPFTLTCTLSNRGDLPVKNARATLVAGGASLGELIFGDVGPGASGTRSLTVNAPGSTGRIPWRLEVSAGAFDDTYTAAASGTFNVVAASAATGPVLALSPAYTYVRATDSPVSRIIRVENTGAGSFQWRATASHAWLQVSPGSGAGSLDLTITILPDRLGAGRNVATVTIEVQGLPPQSLVVVVDLIGEPAAGPVITAVVNGASFQEGFAPGSWISILGERLAQTERVWRDEDFQDGRLPVTLDNVRVKVGGRTAPLYYISPKQLNVLAPDDDAEGEVEVEVVTPQGRAVGRARRQRWAPGVFVYHAAGRSFVAAVHNVNPSSPKSGVLVGPEGIAPGYRTLPAAPGDIVWLYATGLGINTDPRPPFGLLEGYPAKLVDPLELRIGGTPAQVFWSGLVSPGLYQINFVTPDLPSGEHPVEIRVGGSASFRAGGVLSVVR